MQALADQVCEQDSLPLRLQEQLGALWASQQANHDQDEDDNNISNHEDPPTPKSNQSKPNTLHSPSSGSPKDDTPLFPTSPLAPDPTTPWPFASGSIGLSLNNAPAHVPRVVRGGFGFGGVSPGSEGLVPNPENEGEDLVALRSENSQLRAELARQGRVNQLWGKGEKQPT